MKSKGETFQREKALVEVEEVEYSKIGGGGGGGGGGREID